MQNTYTTLKQVKIRNVKKKLYIHIMNYRKNLKFNVYLGRV